LRADTRHHKSTLFPYTTLFRSTKEGITALQMDIKIDGLSKEILEESLEQAKIGRVHIIDSMLEVINEPRVQLSEYAPKILTMFIDRKSTRLNSSHVSISYAVFC